MTPIKPEQNTVYLSSTFKDANGAAAQPASAQYRIDNVTTQAQILTWTATTPSGGVASITITAAQLAMLAPRLNEMELIRVSVEATYGAGDKVRNEHDFWIQRQNGL